MEVLYIIFGIFLLATIVLLYLLMRFIDKLYDELYGNKDKNKKK